MGGPWEKFQNAGSQPEVQAEGPWSKFASGEAVDEGPKMSFKGLLENVAKEIPKLIEATATQVKEGLYDIPKAIGNLPREIVQGTKPQDTQLGKYTQDRTNAMAEGLKGAVEHPVETAYNNPISAAATVFGAGRGAMSLGSKGLQAGAKGLSKVGAAMEEAGAKGQNYAAGLRQQTIEAMTKGNQNPGDVGVKVGATLAKENIIGSTPKATYDNLIKAKDVAGKEVGAALKDIHGNGVPAVSAEEALSPMLEAIKERTGAATSARKAMAKPFQEIYNHLIKNAEGGKISLEQVRKAMNEVGPMTVKGSEEVQAAMSELYGNLASVQENMVNVIAKTAKKPELTANLLKANAKYSLYKRIAPDLKKAAAKESVGKASFFASPVENLKKTAATYSSKLLTKAGSGLNSLGMDPSNKAVLDAAMKRLKGGDANAQ
jgi:hypothetical protein